MLIAQITDTHLKSGGRLAYGKVDTAAALSNSVAHVNALNPRPDAVIITGDLADMGRPEAYALFREIVDGLAMPYYVIPGNHDETLAFRDAFQNHAYLPSDGPFLHYAVEDYSVRLVGLDTTVRGKPHGLLCAERLDWLDRKLTEFPEKTTLIFMHHPPFLTGIGHMDRQNCRNAEGLDEVVRRHTQVVRITCGHVHRPMQTLWAGVCAGIAPGTSHSVALDLNPDGPPAFVLEPPACQLFYQTGDGNLVSHLSFIGDFEGPHPFFDNSGALID